MTVPNCHQSFKLSDSLVRSVSNGSLRDTMRILLKTLGINVRAPN